VCNGQEALDLLEKGAEEVGLVILDWNMPVLSGLSTSYGGALGLFTELPDLQVHFAADRCV
jgi:hypothetical protein